MTVSVDKNGAVWTVIADRYEEARNAVNPEHGRRLLEAFQAFDADDTARVAVFWGAGGAFCAGWDLKYGATMTDPGKFQKEIVDGLAFPIGAKDASPGPMGVSRLEVDKPVIGAIEGPAVAGGMELALWCDFRVMAEDAYMGLFERRWGIPLIDGGTIRLPKLVGLGRAMEIAMTGRKVTAEECLRIGLCEYITEPGHARAFAEDLAARIAVFPQAALLADKRSMIECHGMPFHEALKREWANGVDAVRKEGAAGAAKFSSGVGRHGDFSAFKPGDA